MAPDFQCAGFWPAHDAMWPLEGAILFLRGAGVKRPGLFAALLELEGDAIEYACRLIDVASEEEMIAAISQAEDPGVALFHWGSHRSGLPVGDPWPALLARTTGEVPAAKGPFFEIEPHLRGELGFPYWFAAAQGAFTLGDKDAASTWMSRGLRENPPPETAREEVARLVEHSGTPEEIVEALKKGHAATLAKLAAESVALIGEQSGEQSEPFLHAVVGLCVQYIELGAPQTSVLLLSKVLGFSQDAPTEAIQLPALPTDLAERLGVVLKRFIAGPVPAPSPEIAEAARDALSRALLAQGRYEEAELLPQH